MRSPLTVPQIVGRCGEVISVPEAAPKDVRPSNVHWLTPRTWQSWMDVGLRGHTRGGVPRPGWVGRLEDREELTTAQVKQWRLSEAGTAGGYNAITRVGSLLRRMPSW